jgi:hypothetical protein
LGPKRLREWRPGDQVSSGCAEGQVDDSEDGSLEFVCPGVAEEALCEVGERALEGLVELREFATQPGCGDGGAEVLAPKRSE